MVDDIGDDLSDIKDNSDRTVTALNSLVSGSDSTGLNTPSSFVYRHVDEITWSKYQSNLNNINTGVSHLKSCAERLTNFSYNGSSNLSFEVPFLHSSVQLSLDDSRLAPAFLVSRWICRLSYGFLCFFGVTKVLRLY